MSEDRRPLAGAVAVVTGATSGIGAATASRLAAAGAHVVLVGRREREGREVAAGIGEAATFVRADVADDDAAHGVIDGVVERWGRLDCLVNNAGLPGQLAGVADVDLARWDRLMAVNLRAPLVMIRRAAPAMVARGEGAIVNIASVNGERAGFAGHDYSVAKAGLLHLTRSAAVELGEHGVRVNSVSPGPVATGIFAKGRDGAAGEATNPAPFAPLLPAVQPLPRVGRVEDVAAAVEFLASPAGAFVNGHDLVVDGGISAGRPWSVMQSDWATITGSL